MPRLIGDRFVTVDAHHAWELATGRHVRLADAREDQEVHEPPLEALVEALEHGQEGSPRWVVAPMPMGGKSLAVVQRAAADARARGFIAVDVEVYGRLHDALADDLRGRTLLLIGRPGLPAGPCRAALVHAAARSPRPHVLLTFEPPSVRPTTLQVREARAAYGGFVNRTPLKVPLPPDVRHHVERAARAPALAREGRHAAAGRLLRDVAGALHRRRAFTPEAHTLIRLGRLLLERGRAVAADEAFEDAAAAAQSGEDEPLTLEARIWQVLARTDAAQLTAAESLCRAVIASGALPPSQRFWAEAALARALIWQDREDEAVRIVLESPSDGEIEEALALYIGATGVRLSLAQDDIFTAGQRARALVTRARLHGDPLHSVIALTAHFRVMAAAGDLALAEADLAEILRDARRARAPLLGVRARLIWADLLRRAGRGTDAEREYLYLRRLRRAMPPLVRQAIDRRLRDTTPSHPGRRRSVAAPASAAAALIAIAQEEEQDREAVRGVLAFIAAALRTSRVDVCSACAGPVSVVVSTGAGLPTTLGPRVLEAGLTLGSESGLPGHEIGVPIRLGPKLLAAVVARWPVDRVPPAPARDVLAIAAAVLSPRVESMLSTARDTAQASTAIPELVGTSAAMDDVRKAISRAAAAPFAVLIEGESGAGKELVARAIHQLSPRRERRFCDVNCAALPDDLLESELFGHARGAFTGAVTERAGLFEEAHGGTLFLDEVADLSARAQAKLLRVLQQQEIRRLGETFSRKVDVRVVSAANRDMRPEAADGRFRQDLLYRLDVIRIRIPPLRERPEDIAVLVRHFWEASAARVGTRATLSHAAMAALSRYHWPGNVRELQNVLAALAVAAPPRGRVSSALLPAAITGAAAVTSARLADARMQFERRFVEIALARAGASRSRAARDLGLTRQGLLKMMARLGIEERSE
jgi:DNA-binding NtrC family response regulator/tetratricopeptide (TPR) repeat protein